MSIIKSNNVGLIERLVEKINNKELLTIDQLNYLQRGENLYTVYSIHEYFELVDNYKFVFLISTSHDFSFRNQKISFNWVCKDFPTMSEIEYSLGRELAEQINERLTTKILNLKDDFSKDDNLHYSSRDLSLNRKKTSFKQVYIRSTRNYFSRKH